MTDPHLSSFQGDRAEGEEGAPARGEGGPPRRGRGRGGPNFGRRGTGRRSDNQNKSSQQQQQQQEGGDNAPTESKPAQVSTLLV